MGIKEATPSQNYLFAILKFTLIPMLLKVTIKIPVFWNGNTTRNTAYVNH